MANSVDFSKRSLALVTGASKGIGRSIAVELSKLLTQDSIVILMARSESGLKETKSQLQEHNKHLTVMIYNVDLSTATIADYECIFKNVLISIDNSNIHYGAIFHNAASGNILKQTKNLTNLEEWRNYYDLNLFSVALLNSTFIKYMRPVVSQLVIVNITSILGRLPTANMAMYGTSKAARDLFFKILAVEEPYIIVLTYGPGPVDTDLFNNALVNTEPGSGREFFNEKKKKLLTTVQTVNKLLGILNEGNFNNGEIVDYSE